MGQGGISFGSCSWRCTAERRSVLPTREPPFHSVLARVRVRGKVKHLLAKWSATCLSILRSPTPFSPPKHRRAVNHSNPKFTVTVDPYPNSPWTYIGHFLAHLLSLAFLSLSHQSPVFRCLSLRRRQSAAVGALTVAKPFSKVARHSSWCSYLSLSF
jgi:hypothetical protein